MTAFLNLENALLTKISNAENKAPPSWERELDRNGNRWSEHLYTYTMDDDDGTMIEITEDFDQLGHRVWDLAICMSKYFEHAVSTGSLELSGKVVIEVGAGCGLLALVLHRLGAHVVVTEIECILPHLISNISSNLSRWYDSEGEVEDILMLPIGLEEEEEEDGNKRQKNDPIPRSTLTTLEDNNSSPKKIWIEELDWFKTDIGVFDPWTPFDLIISSDITVFPQDLPHIDKLFSSLYLQSNPTSLSNSPLINEDSKDQENNQELLKCRCCPILIGACERREPHEDFILLMRSRFDQVTIQREEMMHPNFSTNRSVIVELRCMKESEEMNIIVDEGEEQKKS